MTYFSNGIEAEMFQEKFCHRCVNWRDPNDDGDGCPIIDLHYFWNYDAVGKDADETKRAALDHFITGNGATKPWKCSMFQEGVSDTRRKEQQGRARNRELAHPWMKAMTTLDELKWLRDHPIDYD